MTMQDMDVQRKGSVSCLQKGTGRKNMERKIIFATGNQDKMKEIRMI